MLSKNQLVEQLALQNKMNATVNPDWLKAGHAWHRAIMVEAVEALDHYGWKWWKKSEPDVVQVQIELVDIWHFVLSATLVGTNGDNEWAAQSVIGRFENISAPPTRIRGTYSTCSLLLLAKAALTRARSRRSCAASTSAGTSCTRCTSPRTC